MDKYKVIAEKITYSLDGYIADHNNRNFGDADGWLRHVRNGWEEFIEAHPDSLNLHEYLQHHQAKVEELQTQLSLQRQRVKAFEEELTSSRNYGDELQKRVDELEFQLKDWKQKSMPAMLNGMCGRCGKEPLQGIGSDKEDYALLHCFGCGANKYEWIGEQALKGEG